MRAFVVLSFVVCLAVAKPQYGYNYEPPTAYQTSASGLQQQQQYSLAAPVQQTQYTQPQSYAAYPTQDQYYQSYSTAAAPIQQTTYTSQEQQPSLLQSTGQFDQASYANAAPLQQNAYAGVSQTQFDQTQLQQASYPTAGSSSLEQSSYASAGQVQFEQVQLQQVAPLEQTSFVGASQAPLQQTSYSTASSSGLEQSSYANAGQTQFAQAQYQQAAFPTASPSPLEQSSYANAGQSHFDQAQLQQTSYPTASPSPLEQSSYANAGQSQFDQAQLQQASYPTASPSPVEQSSYTNAGQTQFDQTQYQQTAFPTASPSPLEQSSYAGNQLPLTLPTSASYETGFLPSQSFPLQQEPSPSTTFNGLTGFNAQPYQAATYSNGAAYDQSQFFNVDSSYTTNTDFAQLQQYASQLSQAKGQQDDTSGTLDSFNIQSTIGPNPADIAPPSPSPAPVQQQQQQQQQDEPQNVAQNTEAQGPAFNAQAQPQSQAFDDQGPPQGPAFNAGAQQQEAEQPEQPQQQQQQDQQQQFGPNQSQNVLPLEQIAPEPIQARQKQQGPVTTIHKHIYVHVPPPDFEEPEPLPQAPLVENKNKRYNIIFIKAPNVARPTIIQPQQNEDKTIVYVLVKKPDEIQPFAQPEPRFGKPEVFFIKYKAQKEQTAAEELPQEQQPQQAEDPESVVVEDRSKQPSQAPQFPALEGQEAQALLREEEQKQQQDEQQDQQQPQTLAAPSPTRAPSNAGISPLPIDFIPPAAPKTASPAPPQNYLPPSFQQ